MITIKNFTRRLASIITKPAQGFNRTKAVDLVQELRPYRRLYINLNGDDPEVGPTINYILENTIGPFTIEWDGAIATLTFINEDLERDGSTNMGVSIYNLKGPANHTTLELLEFYNNKLFLNVLDANNNQTTTFYEAMVDVQMFDVPVNFSDNPLSS